jgi:hypothetical protein
MSLFLRAGSLYKRSVNNYPFIAQGVQSSILMATGDLIAQKFVEKKKDFDYRRCGFYRFLFFNLMNYL